MPEDTLLDELRNFDENVRKREMEIKYRYEDNVKFFNEIIIPKIEIFKTFMETKKWIVKIPKFEQQTIKIHFQKWLQKDFSADYFIEVIWKNNLFNFSLIRGDDNYGGLNFGKHNYNEAHFHKFILTCTEVLCKN